MSQWSHLPNAAHIDAVLAHVKAHPQRWVAARVAAWDAVRDAAWDAAWAAAWDAAWGAARDAALDVARGSAWDACVALIAWDDAGALMDADMNLIKFLVEVQDPRAMLLLPARIAMQTEAS